MGGKGGVEEGAVGRWEAGALDFQGKTVVEDLWVAPDKQFVRDLIVSPKKKNQVKVFLPEKNGDYRKNLLTSFLQFAQGETTEES